jgi:hypothetical protein
MVEQQAVDITELAVLGEQFPLRLMQVMDEAGRDQVRYVQSPVCIVPAGPFLMGSSRQLDTYATDDELPQHEVTLPAFQIGQYPLTVAEYACFVHSTPHPEPKGFSFWPLSVLLFSYQQNRAPQLC